ncbi:hypothetical protein [Paenibacillus sp. NPDC058071]|uniref:hypothetical protein n=1 Tax=Paenibacillus sp. NPDC058071 TaxID=3346326 RepID=UPI0036DB2B29
MMTNEPMEDIYNGAVLEELRRRAGSLEQADQIFHQLGRPLLDTWGYELNPEALADEMLKLWTPTNTKNNKLIKGHFRSRPASKSGLKTRYANTKPAKNGGDRPSERLKKKG